MAISRQKMMVTWTRVEAKETEVFCYWTYLEEESSGFSIKLDMEMRKTEIEDNFRKFNCTGDSFDSVNWFKGHHIFLASYWYKKRHVTLMRASRIQQNICREHLHKGTTGRKSLSFSSQWVVPGCASWNIGPIFSLRMKPAWRWAERWTEPESWVPSVGPWVNQVWLWTSSLWDVIIVYYLRQLKAGFLLLTT